MVATDISFDLNLKDLFLTVFLEVLFVKSLIQWIFKTNFSKKKKKKIMLSKNELNWVSIYSAMQCMADFDNHSQNLWYN